MMENLSKGDIKKSLGKSLQGYSSEAKLFNPLALTLRYLSGSKCFDEYLSKSPMHLRDMELNEHENGLEIKISSLFSSANICLLRDQIKAIFFFSKENSINSAIADLGKAILLGPVAAGIIQQISFGLKEGLSPGEGLLCITYIDEQKSEQSLQFAAISGKFDKVEEFFKTFYLSKYQLNSSIQHDEKCPKCQKPIPANASNCGNCGYSFR